jgi:ankyrin repeat protein
MLAMLGVSNGFNSLQNHQIPRLVSQPLKLVTMVSKDAYQESLVSHCAYHGHLEVVKWLIEECGADAWQESSNGYNALTEAVSAGNLEVAQYLYHKGYSFCHEMEIRQRTYRRRLWSLGAFFHGKSH